MFVGLLSSMKVKENKAAMGKTGEGLTLAEQIDMSQANLLMNT